MKIMKSFLSIILTLIICISAVGVIPTNALPIDDVNDPNNDKTIYMIHDDVTKIILSADEFPHTNYEVKPEVIVKYNKNNNWITLKQGTDYQVTYKNNINIGEATVTITGISDFKHHEAKDYYLGSVSRNFKIGHNYDKGVITTAPTTDKTGIKTYTCSVCKATKTEVIPKLVPIVSGFKITATAYNAIKLGWNPVADADGYIIWRYDFAKKQWIQINNNVKTNSFLFTHLNSGTKYRFAVRAFKKIDGKVYTSSSFPVVDGYTYLPTVAGFKVTATANNAIKLGWNNVAGANGYYIYRYDYAKKQWLLINNNVKTNSFLFTHLNSGTNYKFAVRAYKTVDGKNILSQSFPVVETSTNPANVNFNLSTSSGRVNVKWNKVAGATGYMVFYKTSANGSWNKITQVNANTTSCVKTGLKKGQTYYFMVRAYKTLGKTNFLANYNTKTIKVK